MKKKNPYGHVLVFNFIDFVFSLMYTTQEFDILFL